MVKEAMETIYEISVPANTTSLLLFPTTKKGLTQLGESQVTMHDFLHPAIGVRSW